MYYPLARLQRTAWQANITADQITDLRRTNLTVTSYYSDVQQIAADAFGSNYTFDKDGQPNLKISLRETINALLRGTIPTTPVMTLTTAIFEPPMANYLVSLTSFIDSQKISWVFWDIHGHDSGRSVGKASIWCKRYDPNI